MKRSEVNEKFKALMQDLNDEMANPDKKTRRISINRTCKAILLLGYEWGKAEIKKR